METIQRSFWVRESDLLSAQEIKLAIMKTKPGANPDVSAVLRGLFEFGGQVMHGQANPELTVRIVTSLLEAGLDAKTAEKVGKQISAQTTEDLKNHLSQLAISAIHPGRGNRHKEFTTEPSETAKKNATGRKKKAEVE